jgi:hypothetical protein
MNRLKKIWKTKIRVLLPNPVINLLKTVGNALFPSEVFSTTNREKFLAKIAAVILQQTTKHQTTTNPNTCTILVGEAKRLESKGCYTSTLREIISLHL